MLYRTNLTGGGVTVFAPTVNIPGGSPSSEHYVSRSLGLAGFPSRDVYVAAANGIIHIDHAGLAGNQFITSVGGIAGSNLASAVRGILFDSIGTFGGDMLVTTIGAKCNEHRRGNPPGEHGRRHGRPGHCPTHSLWPLCRATVFVASEGSGFIRAISPAGVVTIINPNDRIASAEELSFVPLNLGVSGNTVEGFYGANYTPNVVKAGASQFTGLLRDIIVTGENTHLVTSVHWTGSGITLAAQGNFPNQPEDGIFVTSAIINPCRPGVAVCNNVPEPDSLGLLFAAIIASLGAHALWEEQAVVWPDGQRNHLSDHVRAPDPGATPSKGPAAMQALLLMPKGSLPSRVSNGTSQLPE